VLHQTSVNLIDRNECNRNILQERARRLEANADLAQIVRDFRISPSKLIEIRDAIMRNASPPVVDGMFCAGDLTAAISAEQVRDSCQGGQRRADFRDNRRRNTSPNRDHQLG
jgi:hypothetical protein